MNLTKTCAVICFEFNKASINKPLHFFDFPKNNELFKEWCKEILRLDLLQRINDYEKLFVCINHFNSDLYYYENGYKLREGAVPQLN